MFDPDYDPYQELEIAKHNITELIKAYEFQQHQIQQLIHTVQRTDSILLELTQQHEQLVKLMRAHSIEISELKQPGTGQI